MKGFGKKVSFLIFIMCFLFTFRVDGIWSEIQGQGYILGTSVLINQNDNFEYRAKTYSMNKAYLALDPSEVIYISDEGKPIWKKTLASQNVDGAVGKKWMVLCERKSGDIFVLDNEGNLLAEKFSLGPIDSIKILNDAYVAVLKKNRELLLFDKTLKPTSTTILPKGKIIDFGLNPQNTEIVISLLDLSRSDFNTKILFTDLQGNIKSGSHVYAVIPYDVILEDGVIIMVVDAGFLFYNYKGENVGNIETQRTIQNFFYSNQTSELYVHLIDEGAQLESTTPKSEMAVYNQQGTVVRKFIPPFDNIKGMTAFGSDLMLYNDKELAVVSREGKVTKKYVFKDDIQKVHTLDKKSFAVTFIGRMDVYVKK